MWLCLHVSWYLHVCIKHHLSNIWSPSYEQVEQHWGWVTYKSIAYKKSVQLLFIILLLYYFVQNLNMNNIANFQRKVIRIINFKNKYAPVEPLFKETKIMTLNEIIRNCLLASHHINQCLPLTLKNLLTNENDLHKLNQSLACSASNKNHQLWITFY